MGLANGPSGLARWPLFLKSWSVPTFSSGGRGVLRAVVRRDFSVSVPDGAGAAVAGGGDPSESAGGASGRTAVWLGRAVAGSASRVSGRLGGCAGGYHGVAAGATAGGRGDRGTGPGAATAAGRAIDRRTLCGVALLPRVWSDRGSPVRETRGLACLASVPCEEPDDRRLHDAGWATRAEWATL
jgi:hypothetical protein